MNTGLLPALVSPFTVTFQPELPRAGKYEVRLAYSHATNRAAQVPVTIFSADGEKTITINQQEAPPLEGLFISLGQYNFEKQGHVLIANEGPNGSTNVLVFGDAMSEWLSYGLEEAFAETPEIGVTRKPRVNTGLIRTEQRDRLLQGKFRLKGMMCQHGQGQQQQPKQSR